MATTIRKRKRKRCRSCRKLFYPHASAQEDQKTCDGKCRTKHRRVLAKRRRERDLQDHRVEERKRQRKHRKRQIAEVFCTADAPDEVSRAGLTAKAADVEQVILKNWDKQARLSRAGLRRDLQVLLNFSEEN
jgi:hypothetical protein